MAKRLNEQYDEIFKIVGEKVGLSKLTYEHYKRLNKDDVRKKNFDKFMEDNLPVEFSVDEDFVAKVNELKNNPDFKKEDTIINQESFFNLGKKLIPVKDELHKASKPTSSTKTEVNKEKNKKTSFFKRITKNIPSGAIATSAVSLGVSALTMMLGSYAGWPAAAMFGTLNLTFVIPHAIILGYVGVKYLTKKIKDGSIKKWLQNRKNIKQEQELEKMKTIVKENDKGSVELFPTTPEFMDDTKSNGLNDDSFGVKEEPLPDMFNETVENTSGFNKETDVPQMRDPHLFRETKEAPVENKEPIETEFADKEDTFVSEENVPEIQNEENSLDKSIEETTLSEPMKEEISEITELPKEETVVRKPKHAMKNSVDENEKQELENRISLLEWKLEQLNAPSKLPETDEQINYVENMKNQIKTELKKCKQEHKKYEERNISNILKSRKASLSQKLKNIQKTDSNKQLISNIELAIEQIDNYLKLEELEKQGLISKEQLDEKASNAYTVADYVLGESKGRK